MEALLQNIYSLIYAQETSDYEKNPMKWITFMSFFNHMKVVSQRLLKLKTFS